MTPSAILSLLAIASLVPLAVAQSMTVDTASGPVEINYQAAGVEIQSVERTSDSLVFAVETTGDPGSLEITIERHVLDSLEGGIDADYIVYFDDFVDFTFSESETTDTSRTLQLTVPTLTDEIEINGSIIDKDTSMTMSDDATSMEDGSMEEQTTDGDAMMMEEDSMMMMEDDAMMMEEDSMMMQGDAMMDDTMQSSEPSTCGAGTVFDNTSQTCVLVKHDKSLYKELVVGAVAALIISFVIMIILYPISRASSSKTTQ